MSFQDLEIDEIQRDLKDSGIETKTKKLAHLLHERKMLLQADISKFFNEKKYRRLYKRLFNRKDL
jgi:hypothetical protein